jgi:hypothetical protein
MRRAARRLAVVALVLVASTHLPTAAADAWQPSPGAKTIKLADACPGNLLVNGDMESPRPGTLASQASTLPARSAAAAHMQAQRPRTAMQYAGCDGVKQPG